MKSELPNNIDPIGAPNALEKQKVKLSTTHP